MRVDTRPRMNDSAGGLSHAMSQRVFSADAEAQQRDAVQAVSGKTGTACTLPVVVVW